MTLAQLAKLAPSEGRRAERRIVNLAARLRDPGSTLAHASIHNLSTDGFMAETELALEDGAEVWLKLPAAEPLACKVVWVKEGKAGFEFAQPLHPGSLEMIVAAARKPAVRRHFGPQG